MFAFWVTPHICVEDKKVKVQVLSVLSVCTLNMPLAHAYTHTKAFRTTNWSVRTL